MAKYYVQSGWVRLVLDARTARDAAVKAIQWSNAWQAEIYEEPEWDGNREAEALDFQLHDEIQVSEVGFGSSGAEPGCPAFSRPHGRVWSNRREDFEPMFEWVLNALNAGATGVLVTLVLGLEAYLRDRRTTREQATIQDYLEWLRRKEHHELLQGQRVLLDKLEEGGEESEVLQFHLERTLRTVQRYGDELSEILRQVERIDDVDSKLDLIIARLPATTPNQLMIDARVLEALTTGLKGAGVRVALKGPPGIHLQGTLMIVWRLGKRSPRLMLADCVGGIQQDRLSLILNENGSLTLRTYDGIGSVNEITSAPHASCEYVIAFAIWRDKQICLWTNNKCDGIAYMETPFRCLGPTVLFGIDIEGLLSAHAGRPSPSALKMGMSYFMDYNGFNLQKDGIWDGSRYDAQIILSRTLSDNEIREVTRDPWEILKRKGDCESDYRDLSLAIAEEPDCAQLRIARGVVSTWKDDFPGAIIDFDEAIRIDSSIIDPFILRGVAHNVIGNLDQAVLDYRRSLSIDPRNTDAHCRLAWLFATSPHPAFRYSGHALEHSLRAYELGAWRPEVLDVVAASYAEGGEFANAVKYGQLASAGCLDRFKEDSGRRLRLYTESVPFRDESWLSLKEMWRHYQRFSDR